MRFRQSLALGTFVLLSVVSVIAIKPAYAHSCGHGSCGYVWPNGTLSSYEDMIITVSIIGAAWLVAMLVFKFDYMKSRDFYVAKYHPTRDRINRLLFEGKDKRKIVAAIPFLAFGGLLLFVSLQTLVTYGYKEYQSCSSYRMPMCQTTTYADGAFFVILHSLPFIGGGAFLFITGVKSISIVTMKKETKTC